MMRDASSAALTKVASELGGMLSTRSGRRDDLLKQVQEMRVRFPHAMHYHEEIFYQRLIALEVSGTMLDQLSGEFALVLYVMLKALEATSEEVLS